MLRVASVLAVLVLAAPASPGGEGDAVDLVDRLIELNRIQEPELDAEALRREFDALVAKARKAIGAREEPREIVRVLGEVLLADREVGYLSNLYWRDATLAAAVLRGAGNCLATSTLYAAVGDALDLPLHLALAPHHAFAIWDGEEERFAIETTAGGRITAEGHHRRWLGGDPRDAEHFRWYEALDDAHLLAELRLVAASHLRGQGRLDEALALIDEARDADPERLDWRLMRIRVAADATGDRDAAARAMIRLLGDPRAPPTVRVGILSSLAADHAAHREFDEQRKLLLRAFAIAPRSQQYPILSSLASCHRSLGDYRGAARYMELAVTLKKPGDPTLADALYNLAIYQKNDGRLDDALESIRRARRINPENWNLRVIEAGYLCLAGDEERGRELFAAIEAPRTDRDFWLGMRAWFYAVSGEREKFYDAFATCLAETTTPHTLVWIRHDVDLDPYRDEERFRSLLAAARERLLGDADRGAEDPDPETAGAP